MMKLYAFAALAGVAALSACAQTPMAPTVQVMPGANTSLASFQNDQATCRQFAQQAVAGTSNTQASIQAQFDNAFAACMFSLGNTVPGMSPR